MGLRVCMLVVNDVRRDPRVRKEAASLAKVGYDVVVVGVVGEGSGRSEWLDGYRVMHVQPPRFLRHTPFFRWFTSIRRSSPASAVRQTDRLASSSVSLSPGSSVESISWWRKVSCDIREIIYMVRTNWAMLRVAGSYSAQIYHVHDLNALIGGYILSRWQGARLVYDFHELFTEQFRPGIKSILWRRFYGFLEGWLGKRADSHITVCDSIAGVVRERYAFPMVLTVRNVPWYQLATASPAHGRSGKVILYHGAYLRDRGLEQLIAAMVHVREGTLLLRGDGELETALRVQVHQLDLDSRVVFAPPVPISELVQVAADADIGVVPYIGFCLNNRFCLPNKVFEYMMAGLAVAGSDLPELRNVIARHDIGGLFDPENSRDIARVLQQLLDDGTALERMKTNARQVARTTYNWEAESVCLVDAYASIAAKFCGAR
mgnify:CR=1 FL=1